MLLLPFILIAALLWAAFEYSTELAAIAPHLDQIVIAFLAVGLNIEVFSILGKILTHCRIFWLAEALLTITVPVRHMLLIFPGKGVARLFYIEAHYLQTAKHEQQKY